MKRSRRWGLALLLLLVVSAPARAQDCSYTGQPPFPFWVSAELVGGVSSPLSFSDPLVMDRFSPVFGGGVGMNFYNGMRVLLDYQYQSYDGHQSFYHWITMHEVLVRGLFPLIQSRFVDWHAGVATGLNFVSKKYLYPKTNADGSLVLDSEGNVDGLLLLTHVPSALVGVTTRLSVYPIEPWSIFFDVTGTYSIAIAESLSLPEGALLLSVTAGTEVHF